MQITLDFPDNLTLSETDLRIELADSWCEAIALFQQKTLLLEQSATLIGIDVDDFYQILVDRQLLTPPSDPDDTPDELVLAHLRISLQQVAESKVIPVEQLWHDFDD
jgi:predicted HTH domain antitoxin